jgi:hypothetical protein
MFQIRTINQFVDYYKVVLHCFFVDFSKVSLAYVDKTIAELEDECSICVGSKSHLLEQGLQIR